MSSPICWIPLKNKYLNLGLDKDSRHRFWLHSFTEIGSKAALHQLHSGDLARYPFTNFSEQVFEFDDEGGGMKFNANRRGCVVDGSCLCVSVNENRKRRFLVKHSREGWFSRLVTAGHQDADHLLC
ncbi:hypothetical protein CEXT_619091 [Caerostris extrusa]|uniref:Uncharacterized protein n=1 Tax=Caerostris extrusa TaxID=172846 RepID=A0AAV4XQQ5_CAEEX|nr:hypothetical protein CEXT_619091 [Caerostris extrusa]